MSNTVLHATDADFADHVLASDDVKGKLVELGALPSGNTPAQFQALIDADRKRYAQVIADKKITVD